MPSLWRSVLVTAALSASAFVGCSFGASSDEQAEENSSAALDCRDPIDILDVVPDGYEAVADVVALPNAEVLRRGPNQYESESGKQFSFSKMGLVVRSRATFRIEVADASRGGALLRWGNTGDSEPVASLEVDACAGRCLSAEQPGCPEGESGEWVVFPGGLWTLEPGCVSLEVVSAGETHELALPIGEACV